LPDSYDILESAGFSDDYSMGFSSHFGYRAGTGHSFNWYNLKDERETNLKIHPFVMMDSTANFKLKISAQAFIVKLNNLKSEAEKVGGKVHVILHNEHPSWPGWDSVLTEIQE
jgi:hypothetical protein